MTNNIEIITTTLIYFSIIQKHLTCSSNSSSIEWLVEIHSKGSVSIYWWQFTMFILLNRCTLTASMDELLLAISFDSWRNNCLSSPISCWNFILCSSFHLSSTCFSDCSLLCCSSCSWQNTFIYFLFYWYNKKVLKRVFHMEWSWTGLFYYFIYWFPCAL